MKTNLTIRFAVVTVVIGKEITVDLLYPREPLHSIIDSDECGWPNCCLCELTRIVSTMLLRLSSDSR